MGSCWQRTKFAEITLSDWETRSSSIPRQEVYISTPPQEVDRFPRGKIESEQLKRIIEAVAARQNSGDSL